MREGCRRERPAGVWALAGSLVLSGCTVANLSYAEVERDLDALVRVEGAGAEQRIEYLADVRISPWYAKWTLLLPLKPLLLFFLADVERRELDNPAEMARDLLAELGPKADRDLGRAVASSYRFVQVLQLDPSALNCITALDGLECIAAAQRLELGRGLEAAALQLEPPPELASWLADLAALRPAVRQPAGATLSPEQAARYRSVIAGLTAAPLPGWQQRLALVADLDRAAAGETDPHLAIAVRQGVRQALRHAIQRALVDAVQGQAPARVDVRLRALDILHRQGGPDSVPILLSLMINSPSRIADGEPAFDPDVMMQRRLIHLCGQLDRERALRAARLPGRETWQVVAPAEFLARIALDADAFQKPTTLPAREALARCLQRPDLGLGEAAGPDSKDWVAEWYEEFLARQPAR